MPVRASAILTTSYVVGSIIGVKSPTYMNGPVGLYNQLILYVNLTKGSLTTTELIVEFNDDYTNANGWYQETIDDIAGSTGVITEHNATRSFTATGKYRVPIKVNDQYIRVSIKGTGDVTGSLAEINAIIGIN